MSTQGESSSPPSKVRGMELFKDVSARSEFFISRLTIFLTIHEWDKRFQVVKEVPIFSEMNVKKLTYISTQDHWDVL